MKRKPVMLWCAGLLAAGVAALSPSARAHCEIPCGIYTDAMRIEMILEDCQTIEKSMAQIRELSAAGDRNYNQLVRWVTNKEVHAVKIQEVVTQYFMTQRVKPGADGHLEQLSLLHRMLVEAMKCKQTTDPAHVANLRELTAQFRAAYFGPEAAAHAAEAHAGHGP